MSTSVRHSDNRSWPALDLLDQMIQKEGLRIVSVALVRANPVRLIIAILNNQELLKLNVADYPSLKNATDEQLSNWRLIADGVGIHWPDLDEDVSLKGLLTDMAQHNLIRMFGIKE